MSRILWEEVFERKRESDRFLVEETFSFRVFEYRAEFLRYVIKLKLASQSFTPVLAFAWQNDETEAENGWMIPIRKSRGKSQVTLINHCICDQSIEVNCETKNFYGEIFKINLSIRAGNILLWSVKNLWIT